MSGRVRRTSSVIASGPASTLVPVRHGRRQLARGVGRGDRHGRRHRPARPRLLCQPPPVAPRRQGADRQPRLGGDELQALPPDAARGTEDGDPLALHARGDPSRHDAGPPLAPQAGNILPTEAGMQHSAKHMPSTCRARHGRNSRGRRTRTRTRTRRTRPDTPLAASRNPSAPQEPCLPVLSSHSLPLPASRCLRVSFFSPVYRPFGAGADVGRDAAAFGPFPVRWAYKKALCISSANEDSGL